MWFADLLTSVFPCAPLEQAMPSETAGYTEKNDIWDAQSASLSLSGAGNETVLFQMVTEKRAGSLESVAMEGSGALKLQLAVNANISVPVGGVFYDDPVCPVEPSAIGGMSRDLARLLRLKDRQRQTWTIELYIPRGAPAGTHELALVVGLKGRKIKFKVLLTVFGFELPDEVACTADMNAYGVSIASGWAGMDPRSDRYLAVEKEFFRACHDHRSVFHLLPYSHSGRIEKDFAPILEGKGRTRRVKDWTPFDKHWGAYLDGSAFAGTRRGATPVPYLYLPINLNWPAYFEKFGTPGYELEFKNVVREFAVHFAEKGWTKTKFEVFFNHKTRWKYFPWDMDEIRFEKDNKATLYLARLANEAVAGVPGVKFINRIDSSWIFDKSARSELGDAIDLWIVNGSYMAPFPDAAELLKKKGKEVWFYGGAGSIASWHRIFVIQWPWQAWGRGVDGFTWWNALGWSSDMFKNPGRGGDFCLYPGSAVGMEGPLMSVRMKALLRGMQDHAYLSLLTERTGSRAAADAIIKDHLGCTRGREDWWQRGEYPGISGSETRAHKFSPRPWHSAPRTAWNAARIALGHAIEKNK
ncbi:MAG: hypothetical protein C0404_00885 [Verrucomicrobia bacterium]|nr:hypothetical protein [Verrucomicrobiota bacterium]